MGKIKLAAVLLLAVLALTGCHRKIFSQKKSAPATASTSGKIIIGGHEDAKSTAKDKGRDDDTSPYTIDLGPVALTNHSEKRVRLGHGRECLLSPEMVDRHDVQLTLTLESRDDKGKMQDLVITQIVAPTGKPVDVTVGDLNLRLTPNVVAAD